MDYSNFDAIKMMNKKNLARLFTMLMCNTSGNTPDYIDLEENHHDSIWDCDAANSDILSKKTTDWRNGDTTNRLDPAIREFFFGICYELVFS